MSAAPPNFKWDAFICHASEDKESFVDGFAKKLRDAGLQVWYDKFSLKIGDSLRRKIDEGLSESRYGIVVLSKSFFAKDSSQRELDGLTTRDLGEQMILPIRHGVSSDEVKKFSLPLADKFAGNTADGIDRVVEQILEVVKPNQTAPAASTQSSQATPYTLHSLQSLGLRHDTKVDWQHFGKSIFLSHRGLGLTLIEQVDEALKDKASGSVLDELYNRLLDRAPDSVGRFHFLPWIYYGGEHGRAVAERSILVSPEYYQHLPMRKMGARRMTDKVVRFKIDKNTPDGLVKTSSIENGKLITRVSSENIANGYVPREQWGQIADDALTFWKIREYAAATERLHGYSIEMIDKGAPEVKRNEDYWRSLKRMAVFGANAFMDNVDREQIINIIDPAGKTLLSSFDKEGNYRSIHAANGKVVAVYDLHEVIQESIFRNNQVRVPATIEFLLNDYVAASKDKGVIEWLMVKQPIHHYGLKVKLPNESAAFRIWDFVEFASSWKKKP